MDRLSNVTPDACRFTQALVRLPGRSVVDGLRAIDRGAPCLAGVVAEHAAYVRALEAAGVSVEVLPALEAFADSLFVEDTALVFPEGAILLRPGAPSRAGECAHMEPVLRRRFSKVLALEEGHADGGDILTTSDSVMIGRSARTDAVGAAALVRLLATFGRRGVVVDTPPGVLHFKTDCALVDGGTVLATARLASSGVFKGMRVLVVPEGEEAAANALRINDRVFVGEGYPRTADLLTRAGLRVVTLPVQQIGLIDAGLSCMSLRW
ncbi:MAG: dimethylarginine dimethylaminohydrolase [Alphaproteobacteria bacterium]|nr:dimethylarginine dimethylaminohydrolase [Alphaproteobacteria bacterium]